MFQINEMLLRRKDKVIIRGDDSLVYSDEAAKLLDRTITALMNHIHIYGYTLSKEVVEELGKLPVETVKEFGVHLIDGIKPLVGADKIYTPMYPNFPAQVAEASDAELFLNAIFHYWTFGEWKPEYEKQTRFPLDFFNVSHVITIGTDDDVAAIFTNLVGSKTNISDQDKADIATFIKLNADYAKYLPDEIPVKENMAYVVKTMIDNAPTFDAGDISKYFNTATDVLRLITAMSDGDISLAKHTKYRSFTRSERRAILYLLNCVNRNTMLEDMWRYRNYWLRIGERLHPGEDEYKKFVNAQWAFAQLRNERKPKFFMAKVNDHMKTMDMYQAARVLKSRPGEFARQLDKLLRDSSIAFKEMILREFTEVADKISTPVLLQVRQHFLVRNDIEDVRVFFPKGNLAKSHVEPNNLRPISNTICARVVKICEDALIKLYAERDKIGKVYIAPSMKNYIVPFSQRSASASVITRGSSIPVSKDANAIRAFVWWTNAAKVKNDEYWYDGRVDLDLSCALYDEKWGYIQHCSWTNLRSSQYRMYHSGDITNGGDPDGDGVAEFLDIDLNISGARYAVFQVHSFTGQKYSQLPNVRFGWMEREDVNSGEIFEPSTVKTSIDINADATVAIPVIFDLVSRRFIWCDMALNISQRCKRGSTLEANLVGVTATCYGVVNMQKPNMFDLAMLNAMARGEITEYRNEADIIFDTDTTPPKFAQIVTDRIYVNGELTTTVSNKTVDKPNTEYKIITPYDLDYFYGELL